MIQVRPIDPMNTEGITIRPIGGGSKTIPTGNAPVAGPTGEERERWNELPNGFYPAAWFPEWTKTLKPGNYEYYAYNPAIGLIRKGRYRVPDPRDNDRNHELEGVIGAVEKIVTDPVGAVGVSTDMFGLTPGIKTGGIYAVLFVLLLLGVAALALPAVKEALPVKP